MWCARCKTDKLETDFPKNRSSRTGRQAYCKPCHNKYVRERADRLYGSRKNFLLNHRYGISQEELAELIARQKGLCAICKEVPAEHVDHCHQTGEVRGILCFNCNGGIGRFEDDSEVMERAIEYLVRHGR